MDEVSDRYRPAAVEAAVAERWAAVDAYAATKEAHRDDPAFYFLDGPPYTNGSPHMGHAWNKSLKDCYIRYRRMTGHRVIDRPGYDMHGLPIETQVEERLGFENKKDIEDYGLEPFIEECKSFAEEHLEILQEAFVDLGVWMDWDDPYKTLDPTYMEAAWWAFKQAHERGLVEQGKRSISQCPRCETAIANNEVEYDVVEDPSIYVTFPLVGREGSLVVWTTTPWTIPANTFVAVDPALSYQAVEAERDGESRVLWIAEACVEDVLSAGRFEDYTVRETVTGEDMIGWAYEPPFEPTETGHPGGDDCFCVYGADFVEADRTGLVHAAPGHGEEDFARGQELGLPLFCPVGEDGRFTDTPFAGEFVRDANPDIRTELDERGHLLVDDTYAHDYGHCWRCDTGIVQIVTDQWFITVTDVKDDLLVNIGESEWYPAWARDNRFYDFVENSPDWNVSRQRYWGIPLPIWVPEDAAPSALDEDMIVIGTRKELAERVDQDIDPGAVDVHRPTVDGLTITEGGRIYRRVQDVFDVWLDSSVAPWGSLNYPEDPDGVAEHFPADLIIEAHDQTRGWFWSMLGMGTAAMNEIPYRDVLMYGHALMPDGRAMSKSKNLIIDPYEAIDSHGVDVLRLALLAHNPQGEDMRFSWDAMDELERRLNICWNVVRFPLPYMELDDVYPGELSVDAVADDLDLIDEWVLSRLASTVTEMTADLETYRQDRALERLLAFVVEDVSRLYVQEVRERMWLEDDAPEKRAAYATIAHVIDTVARLLAPFAPFLADRIYGILTDYEDAVTVHALDWPEPDESFRDPELEADVAVVRDVEEAALTARQDAGRKLRWPVARVIVESEDETVATAVERRADLLCERVNAEIIKVVEPPWEELVERAVPRMDRIGPSFGADAEAVMEAIEGVPVSVVEDGIYVDGESVELDPEMYEATAEPPEETGGADFEAGSVYVDVSLTPELEAEGYAREVVRRIQTMRKDLDLDIDATIRTSINVEDETIAAYVDEWREYIASETRTADFDGGIDGTAESWEIEGTTVEIAIEAIED